MMTHKYTPRSARWAVGTVGEKGGAVDHFEGAPPETRMVGFMALTTCGVRSVVLGTGSAGFALKVFFFFLI